MNDLPLDRLVLATVRLGPLVWAMGSILGIANRRALVGVVLALAVLLAPVIPPAISGDPAVLMLRELSIGVAMAWVLRCAYSAVEMLGEHIGRDLGMGEAETLLGEGGAASSSLGGILVSWSMLAALLLSGGERVLIQLLARSYELVPPGSCAAGNFGPALAHVLDGAGRAAWAAAAPSIGLSMAIMATLSLAGRVAPQFNAYVAGYPLRIGLGLVLILAATPVMGRPVLRFLEGAVELSLEVIVA